MLNEIKTADSADSDEHYLDHLATINKDRDVVAIQDIYNTTGALLVRQGARIDYATPGALLSTNLPNP
jgi:hypothetical protein